MRRQLSACLTVLCLAVFGALPLSGQNWRPLGPPGGDVRSLGADPSDPRALYLGTSDGHIFGSHDGGEHWELLGRVGSRQDSVVTAIVVDPGNSRTLYSSTWTLGPNGGGVFRSDDGGRSWLAIGLVGQSVRALAQAPSNPDILVAGTLLGVLRSSDAGKNWRQISPANHEDLRNFDSIAIDPHNPDVIYAGTYHLAWKTVDGGREWIPIHAGMIDDSDVMSITIDHTDPRLVYSSACSGIYRSENGGALWTKFRGIPPSARRTHLIRQDPQHPQTLYSATTEGLWKTVDAGVSWHRITPPSWSISGLLIVPKNSDRLVIGVEGLGIYVSDDSGKNFRPANDGFYHRQIVDLTVDPKHPERLLVVLTNAVNPVLATEDGGRTWVQLGAGLKTHVLGHVYAAPEGWWASLQSGGLMHYEERKKAWVRAGLVLSKETLASKRGARPASARTARPLGQVVNDMVFARNLWFAATEDGVLASRDHGATWYEFPLGRLAKLPVHSVLVSEDSSHIWLLSPRGLAFSGDGGKAWAWQDLGFEARGRLRLHQLDDNTLLLKSSNGVHVSGDAGRSWQPFNLPEPWIQDVVIAGNALLVSTQKRGLHISYDRGRTWEHVKGPPAEGYFPVLATGGSTSAVLAASSTEGLYHLEVSFSAKARTSDGQVTYRPPKQ